MGHLEHPRPALPLQDCPPLVGCGGPLTVTGSPNGMCWKNDVLDVFNRQWGPLSKVWKLWTTGKQLSCPLYRRGCRMGGPWGPFCCSSRHCSHLLAWERGVSSALSPFPRGPRSHLFGESSAMCCKNLAHGAAQNCSNAQRKAANVPISVTSRVSRQDPCLLRKTRLLRKNPVCQKPVSSLLSKNFFF